MTDIDDAIIAQDVERKQALTGKAAGLTPDAAVVLTEDAVADMMVPVLDAPVALRCACEGGGIKTDLVSVKATSLCFP